MKSERPPLVHWAGAAGQVAEAPSSFTFLRANEAAEALFPGLTQLSPEQLIDTWFGPGPFRDQVQNWREVSQAGLTALRNAAADTGDPEVFSLLRRADSHSRGHGAGREELGGSFPVVCPVFEFGGRVVRTISAVMRFDSAVEVTTSRLRIELMFPADDEADAFSGPLLRLGEKAPDGRGQDLRPRRGRRSGQP
jgi:hypothetical protein